MKKVIAISLLAVLLIATSLTTFAASYDSPADILSALTNRSVENLVQERTTTQKTYGELAIAAGVSEQFRAEMLKMKEERLQERVANKTMTQEQADAIMAQIKERQATCDGTCDEPQRLMQQQGAGGAQAGLGNGAGNGGGMGFGGGANCGRTVNK